MSSKQLPLKSSLQWTKEEAFHYCQKLATTHYENFTVGSILLSTQKRRHVYTIYSYCRWVDDLGDETYYPMSSDKIWHWLMNTLRKEPKNEKEKRLLLLERWEEELIQCYDGHPTHPVLVALQDTVRTFDIPKAPFLKLIEANRMDQYAHSYATFQDLLNYCEHSANPVGHLVLYLFGYRDQKRQELSDATCTALQLTNFLQDIARDHKRGRIYIPIEDIETFGYSTNELAQGVVNDNFRALMSFQIKRTRELFQQGFDLLKTLKGFQKVEVALFALGGLEVLKTIENKRYDVLTQRPYLSKRQKASIFLRSLFRNFVM